MNSNNTKLLALIHEFRRLFQQPIVTSFADYDYKQARLYHNLILEEAKEYSTAKHRVEILDALGDLTYVIFGAVASVGILPLPYKGKWIKATPMFKPPLLSIRDLTIHLYNPNPSYVGLFHTLTAAYHEMEQVAAVQGVKLFPLTEEIHSSNLSKLWSTDELSALPKNAEAISTPAPDRWIVKRKEDGKVVKSPSYRPPDLSLF